MKFLLVTQNLGDTSYNEDPETSNEDVIILCRQHVDVDDNIDDIDNFEDYDINDSIALHDNPTNNNTIHIFTNKNIQTTRGRIRVSDKYGITWIRIFIQGVSILIINVCLKKIITLKKIMLKMLYMINDTKYTFVVGNLNHLIHGNIGPFGVEDLQPGQIKKSKKSSSGSSSSSGLGTGSSSFSLNGIGAFFSAFSGGGMNDNIVRIITIYNRYNKINIINVWNDAYGKNGSFEIEPIQNSKTRRNRRNR